MKNSSEKEFVSNMMHVIERHDYADSTLLQGYLIRAFRNILDEVRENGLPQPEEAEAARNHVRAFPNTGTGINDAEVLECQREEIAVLREELQTVSEERDRARSQLTAIFSERNKAMNKCDEHLKEIAAIRELNKRLCGHWNRLKVDIDMFWSVLASKDARYPDQQQLKDTFDEFRRDRDYD